MHRTIRAALPALAALALAACGTDDGAATDGQPSPEESTTVRVYFTHGEEPAPVERRVPRTQAVLRAALTELLQGPTAEERAAGYRSFFSEETAGMLDSVTLDDRGRAVVDFDDFSRIIPNASSSAGSQQLLGELNATLFQFSNVRSIVYRFDGSCEAFWEWLQRECQLVTRG